MNKKFILLLSLFIVFTSCRDTEEAMEKEKNNASEFAKSAKQSSVADKNTVSESNFEVPSDSTSTKYLEEEEDPPVKHGGHWKNSK
ncbi:hypothetical protein J2X97_000770 [Epilithonimonas hungarica]|uniref:hypothetical protein n=1 Tax=Epilithonimonas hungarica TaxID=454006 RepID=UPI0027811ED7|nr:hypothetical protein [Epilithonimonas hungarica]MDP9955133.1 hypothetical protein [Epilithonimonas hungarica]